VTIDVSKLPRFIDKITDCNFCNRKDVGLKDVYIEGDSFIKAVYICNSKNCDSMKWLKRPAVQEITIESVKLVDLYKKHQETNA
jgi:hypothetical protein